MNECLVFGCAFCETNRTCIACITPYFTPDEEACYSKILLSLPSLLLIILPFSSLPPASECADPNCFSCPITNSSFCTQCNYTCALQDTVCVCNNPDSNNGPQGPLPVNYVSPLPVALIAPISVIFLLLLAAATCSIVHRKAPIQADVELEVAPVASQGFTQDLRGREKSLKGRILVGYVLIFLGLIIGTAGSSVILGANEAALSNAYTGDTVADQRVNMGNTMQSIGFLCVLVCYIALLVNAVVGGTGSYLRNQHTTGSLSHYIQVVRRTAPVFSFSVECYDMEKYIERTTTTHPDGTKTIEDVVKYRKVITHVASTTFDYTTSEDCSGDLGNVGTAAIVKVSSNWSYRWADDYSRQVYEATRDAFYSYNRPMGEYMDTKEDRTLPGFEKKALLFVDPNKRPAYLQWQFYFLSTILMLGYFYEAWFERISGRASFDFIKVIRVSKMPLKVPVAASIPVPTALTQQITTEKFAGPLLQDRGVRFMELALIPDYNVFINYFCSHYNLETYPCCDKIWKDHVETSPHQNFRATIPFLIHLYSHDAWYLVLNRELTMPVAYFVSMISGDIAMNAQENPDLARPVLYRGVPVAAVSGQEANFFTLTSFSENPAIARKFAGENGSILRLLPTDKTINVMPISHLAWIQTEQEWLVPPRYRFKVIKNGEFFDLTKVSKLERKGAFKFPPFDGSILGIHMSVSGGDRDDEE